MLIETELEAITESELKQYGYSYQIVHEKPYSKVFYLAGQSTLICELTASYVSIEKFRKIFKKMTKYVKEYNVKRFVFDKRHLRTFHQPSMEWYFITWKKEMYELGMTIHRKILPEGEPWFENAVKAGREKIKRQFPDNIIGKLDIAYKDNIKDAIEN